jgi:glycerol kinase
MAWQTRDVVDAITGAAQRPIHELRADGGASVMDLLCQLQADVLGVPVRRPVVQETTALGAAYLAGLGEGVWSSLDEVAAHWQEDVAFTPDPPPDLDARYEQWHRAVERSKGWARTQSED